MVLATTDVVPYFELSPTDRAMAVLHEESPFTPRIGIELDSELDPARLGRALELLARRHPILTATTDLLAWPARWHAGTTTPELVECDDPLAGDLATLDVTAGPTSRLVHIRDGDRSRLVFGAHHATMDGVAILLLLDDLRALYEMLQHGARGDVDVDWNPRTLGALLTARGATLARRTRDGWEITRRWASAPRSTHRDVHAAGPGTGDDRLLRFDDALVSAVETGARTRGWRLNHVVLALLARSWSRVVGREPGEPSVSGWLVTVDCRRRLGASRGAGNLSGLEPVGLVGAESLDLATLIDHVRAEFAPLAHESAGLAAELLTPAAGSGPALDRAMREAFAIRARASRYSRLYSHTDRLPATLARWGDARAVDLRWEPDGDVVAPYVAMVLVRFAGTTTITPFCAPESLPAEHVATLRAEMQAGLEEAASLF